MSVLVMVKLHLAIKGVTPNKVIQRVHTLSTVCQTGSNRDKLGGQIKVTSIIC